MAILLSWYIKHQRARETLSDNSHSERTFLSLVRARALTEKEQRCLRVGGSGGRGGKGVLAMCEHVCVCVSVRAYITASVDKSAGVYHSEHSLAWFSIFSLPLRTFAERSIFFCFCFFLFGRWESMGVCVHTSKNEV